VRRVRRGGGPAARRRRTGDMDVSEDLLDDEGAEEEEEERADGHGWLRLDAGPQHVALPLAPVHVEQGEHGRCSRGLGRGVNAMPTVVKTVNAVKFDGLELWGAPLCRCSEPAVGDGRA